MEKPTVSVCMVTYGQERFIEEAIKSVLMQECNFEIELIVGNDCSPDKTDEIIQNIKQNHLKAAHINYIKHEKNIGMALNFLSLLKKSRGKYIAILDGDDYWTDVDKLQKQVDFLEANPDFAICFHRAKIIYENGITPFYPDINIDTKDITSMEDIIKGNYIHTPTVIFRNNIVDNLPEWFGTVFPVDWVLYIMSACYGKIKFMQDEMCVYRVHSNGIFSTKNNENKILKYLPTIKNLGLYLKDKHTGSSKNLLNYYYEEYFNSMVLRNEEKVGRIARSYIFLKSGFKLRSKKMIAFFWLPIIFGSKSETIWKKLKNITLKPNAKTKHH